MFLDKNEPYFRPESFLFEMKKSFAKAKVRDCKIYVPFIENLL